MAKILCVLYDDPIDGYPPSYAREELPQLEHYPDGRTMPHYGMTPHTSVTSLPAQARYAAGVREILECWFDGRPIREDYLIVDSSALAGVGAHSYSPGNVTAGSDEAAQF